MKKLITFTLAMLMVLSLAACAPGDTSDKSDASGAAGGVDLSGYPTSLNDWSMDDFVRYFTDAGVFTDELTVLTMGDDVWAGTALSGNVLCTDSTSMVSINIYLFDESNPTVDVPAFLAYVRENHTFDESLYLQPVDHLVGTVAFAYSKTIDEKVYNAMDAAYNALIEGMGVTPDF